MYFRNQKYKVYACYLMTEVTKIMNDCDNNFQMTYLAEVSIRLGNKSWLGTIKVIMRIDI